MPTGYSAILIGASVMTLGVTSPNPPEPPPADGDVPTLSPGAGWTGLTPDPDPIGDSEALGYDATAIGRWDCAQNDTWTGDKYVGIALGAHIGGIDRVDFSVNNGTWGRTAQPRVSQLLWQSLMVLGLILVALVNYKCFKYLGG